MCILPQSSNIAQHVINDPATFPPHVWQARQTTIEKAETLWDDGYTSAPVAMTAPGVYYVYLPPTEVRVDKKTGEVTDRYVVDIVTATCNCKGFEMMRGICKHLLAVQWRIAQYQNFLAPLYADALRKAARAAAEPEPTPAPAKTDLTCPKCGSAEVLVLDEACSVCRSCSSWIDTDEKTTTTEVVKDRSFTVRPPVEGSNLRAASVAHYSDFAY